MKKRDIIIFSLNCHGFLFIIVQMQIEELEEILLTISYKDDDKESSLEAFNTLYRGYSKLLSTIVKSPFEKNGDL